MNLKSTVLCSIILLFIVQRITAMKFLSKKFFTDDEEFDGEIEYRLAKNPAYLFGQQISFNERATSFKIGTDWTERIGNRKDKAECTRLMADQYKDEFRTVIGEHISATDKIVEVKNEEFYNYFVFTNREVWECTNKNTASHPSRFYRIVNVLQGNYEVHKIYYSDGIQVNRFYLPVMDSKDYPILHNPVTSLIREIKYLDIHNLNKQLKYEGTFEYYYPNGDFTNEEFSMFKAVHVNERDNIHLPGGESCNYQVDIPSWLKKENSLSSDIGLTGDALRIGETWSDEIGSSEDEATCVKASSYDDRLYTSIHLPDCQLYLDEKTLVKNKNNDFKEYHIPILAEYFTVTKHELWNCEIKPNNKNFLRIVTELIGRKPIKKVEYYDGTSVWKYSMNDKHDQSVKIKIIHYCSSDHDKRYLKYSGVLHLISNKEGGQGPNDPDSNAEFKVKYNKYKNSIHDPEQ
ncbi:hypothetical protein LSTR_LSTR006015 [Laodelphax striatellus]|uniref:Glycosyltransferase family 92 protein n=1 Tax=Laodelphax striatellus TaxID=195883 RepID=A0A482XS36_LAOST|nr:hypothetical protein LSTR_LSTR006015 [Laodelphax striatellus]